MSAVPPSRRHSALGAALWLGAALGGAAYAGTLSVNVVDVEGRPVSLATVEAWPRAPFLDALSQDGASAGPPIRASTDGEGMAALTVNSHEGYVLRVRSTHHIPVEIKDVVGDGDAVHAVLRPGTQVRMTVVDLASGLRLACVSADVVSSRVPFQPLQGAETNECGELALRLQPGLHDVLVHADGYSPVRLPVEVGSDDRTLPFLALARSIPSSILVFDQASRPISEALVVVDLGGATHDAITWAATGADGIALLDLPPGSSTYVTALHAATTHEVREQVRLRQRPDGALTMDLRMTRGASEGGASWYPASSALKVRTGTAAVGGNILDKQTGRPLPNCEVVLEPVGREGGLPLDGWRWPEGFTGSDGDFAIRNVPPGNYQVAVQTEGFRPFVGHQLTVADMQSLKGVLITLERATRISGRVIDARSGQGLSGALVLLSMNRGESASEVTDDDGHFTYDGAHRGRWVLTVAHPDHAMREIYVDIPREGELQDVTVELAPASRIRGRVTYGGVAVADAHISTSARLARTDEEGEFVLDEMPAGFVALDVLAFPNPQQRGISAHRYLSLDEGEDVRLDLELQGQTRLTGDVRLGGQPIAGAVEVSSLSDRVRVGEDGTFEARQVPAGRTRVVFQGDNWLSYAQDIVVTGDPVQHVLLDIPACGIEGRIVDAMTLAPVADATVSAGRGFHVPGTTSDQRGAFRLAGVSPGNHDVAVLAQGYATSITRAHVEPGQILDIRTIALQRELATFRLSGAVTLPDGSPAARAVVSVQAVAHSVGDSGFTDASGRYSIDGVVVGMNDVQVKADGYKPLLLFDVPMSPESTADFQLEPQPIVEVVVTRSGVPLIGAQVALDGGSPHETNGSGVAILEPLAAGNLEISVAFDGITRRTNVELGNELHTRLQVDF